MWRMLLKSAISDINTDLRQHFFSERVINVWNSLDKDTIAATSINCFKGHLQKRWETSLSRHLDFSGLIDSSGWASSPGWATSDKLLLANVNCCRPSVCFSVCLSVTFVRPTQAVQIFGNISTALYTLAIRWHASTENFTKIVTGELTPPPGELNTRGVAKYSDFGPIDGYISEKVQDRR